MVQARDTRKRAKGRAREGGGEGASERIISQWKSGEQGKNNREKSILRAEEWSEWESERMGCREASRCETARAMHESGRKGEKEREGKRNRK